MCVWIGLLIWWCDTSFSFTQHWPLNVLLAGQYIQLQGHLQWGYAGYSHLSRVHFTPSETDEETTSVIFHSIPSFICLLCDTKIKVASAIRTQRICCGKIESQSVLHLDKNCCRVAKLSPASCISSAQCFRCCLKWNTENKWLHTHMLAAVHVAHSSAQPETQKGKRILWQRGPCCDSHRKNLTFVQNNSGFFGFFASLQTNWGVWKEKGSSIVEC